MHRGSPLNEYLFNKHYDTWKIKRENRKKRVHQDVKKGASGCKKRVHQDSPTIETSTIENTILKNSGKPGNNSKVNDKLNIICEQIYRSGLWDKPHVFKNTMLKQNKNEKAIEHVLINYLKISQRKKIEDPMAYCIGAMKKENGNFFLNVLRRCGRHSRCGR